MRSTYGRGRVAPAEHDAILGNVSSWAGTQPRGVVFCHGAGDLTADPLRDQFGLLSGMAETATVLVADLGGDTWANDTGIARVGAAIAHLRSAWGLSGKVALVGMSMGHALACSYALAHPENVSAIAGVIPLVDMRDAMSFASAGINAAYEGAFSESVHGPTHNPAQFFLPESIAHRLWVDVADPLTPLSVAQAFVAERPHVELTELPGWGHTDAAVTVATPQMVEWVADVSDAS